MSIWCAIKHSKLAATDSRDQSARKISAFVCARIGLRVLAVFSETVCVACSGGPFQSVSGPVAFPSELRARASEIVSFVWDIYIVLRRPLLGGRLRIYGHASENIHTRASSVAATVWRRLSSRPLDIASVWWTFKLCCARSSVWRQRTRRQVSLSSE